MINMSIVICLKIVKFGANKYTSCKIKKMSFQGKIITSTIYRKYNFEIKSVYSPSTNYNNIDN